MPWIVRHVSGLVKGSAVLMWNENVWNNLITRRKQLLYKLFTLNDGPPVPTDRL